MALTPNDLIENGAPMPGIPWAEFISRTGVASGEGSAGYEQGNQESVVYIVYWEDLQTAEELLLGVNRLIPYPNQELVLNGHKYKWQISRIPPARHPVKPWLYGNRTSHKPIRWNGKEFDVGPLALTTSGYEFALIVCTYTMPKYRVLDDGALDELFPPVVDDDGQIGIRQEQNRFVEYVPQIGVEAVQREGGTVQGATAPNFKWAEGVLAGQSFQSPTSQAVPVGDVVFMQRRVPLYGGVLSSSTGFLAANFLDMFIGSVVSVSFLGRDPQTLRYNGYRIIPQESPMSTATMYGDYLQEAFAEGYPPLVCDIEHSFAYRNPPSFSTTKGHNLAPIPGDAGGRWGVISPSGNITNTTWPGIYPVLSWEGMFSPPG